MKEFDRLIEVLECLLAPDGCPWDREQTLASMRHLLLEETCEVIEAVDLNRNEKIEEELGDLFFNTLFMCRLAQKENRFTVANVLNHLTMKLIRRHPHIFGDTKESLKIENAEHVLEQWDKIKKIEQHESNASVLDNIPKELPSLARAQKIFKKIRKTSFSLESKHQDTQDALDKEEVIGAALFDLVRQSQEQGLEAEQCLRKFISKMEQRFRSWERK